MIIEHLLYFSNELKEDELIEVYQLLSENMNI